jgi:hypothetical protein
MLADRVKETLLEGEWQHVLDTSAGKQQSLIATNVNQNWC